nr:immunoglobulin heavy chain junction region [Macaca mulatta]
CARVGAGNNYVGVDYW